MTDRDVRDFYDEFSGKLLKDYVYGNRRVHEQEAFLSAAICPDAQRILVVGCGLGQVAWHLAARIAKKCLLLAVDISEENLRAAQALFAHHRVEYRLADALIDDVGSGHDYVVLPDVYEHIPAASRRTFHEAVHRCLASAGSVVLTYPSPEHQRFLAGKGTGLQVVDEVVTFDDLKVFAEDVAGRIVHYSLRSVFKEGDYIHAVIRRGTEPMAPLLECCAGILSMTPPPWENPLRRYLGLNALGCRYRRYRVWRHLGRTV